MKLVALAGGVGASKLLLGLSRVLDPAEGVDQVAHFVAPDPGDHAAAATRGRVEPFEEEAEPGRARQLAVGDHAEADVLLPGHDAGDLLIVGWGSTLGAIEEAVDRAREEGVAVGCKTPPSWADAGAWFTGTPARGLGARI